MDKNNILKLDIAVSPCPNDTFIYGALANRLIASRYDFNFSYHDIETLNLMALKGECDLIKMSFRNYFNVRDKYTLLPCGGALGMGCGPLLITADPDAFRQKSRPLIAIPGYNTTANFLLHFFNKDLDNLVEMPFDRIEQALLDKKADAGVIIHENRFTYASKGLQLIRDLGSHWEEMTQAPIPLGCLAVKNELAAEISDDITQLVQHSISYARKNYNQIHDYILAHAREMEQNVIKSHIDLYVNDFSYSMGVSGQKAVEAMEEHLYSM